MHVLTALRRVVRTATFFTRGPPTNPADPLFPQLHACAQARARQSAGKRMRRSNNKCRTRLPGWRSSALLSGLAPRTGPAPSASQPALASLAQPCSQRHSAPASSSCPTTIPAADNQCLCSGVGPSVCCLLTLSSAEMSTLQAALPDIVCPAGIAGAPPLEFCGYQVHELCWQDLPQLLYRVGLCSNSLLH